ncbi:hypothetical protein CW743_10640 [Staphylococcus shinii]|nr:hypothetical protein CW743_10640 [Staphylococcus shinii]
MAKYFTSNKVGLYLLAIIIIQPLVFKAFDLDSSLVLEIISHGVFILVGLICIYLDFYFHKNKNHHK